jgi:outer membrane murein-binding lipoprotein Lpp
MISLRYHAVSIAAIFLALAVGVLLGASGVSDRVLGAVTSQRDDLAGRVERLTSERDALAAQERASDEFAARIGPAAVRGLLSGQYVTVVAVGADAQDRAAVATLVGQAGGAVTGQLELTEAIGDPARADQLRELTSQLLPAGAQLPAASDTGSLVGGLLGGVLLARDGQEISPEDVTSVLTGLTSAGFVAPGDAPTPANLVVVLTGGAQPGVSGGDSAAVVARLAAELDRAGRGAVLAGRTGSAEATGPIGVARADPQIVAGLSTVDDVHGGPGRVAAQAQPTERPRPPDRPWECERVGQPQAAFRGQRIRRWLRAGVDIERQHSRYPDPFACWFRRPLWSLSAMAWSPPPCRSSRAASTSASPRCRSSPAPSPWSGWPSGRSAGAWSTGSVRCESSLAA